MWDVDPIRILLVDDHQLFRAGLRAILAGHQEFSIVGEAADARTACALAQSVPHDLLIVDVTLPGSNGLAAIRELRRQGDRSAALVLTMHANADMVLDAFAAGATGYALKLQSEDELLDAIRSTAAGRRYAAPQIASLAGDTVRRVRQAEGVLATLSAREREIFDLLVRGHTNAQVAKQLYISIKTVETHRSRIMRKLDVHNIGEMIRLAARHGLLAA